MVLSTGGGESYVALGIYDLISQNEKPVKIIVNGPCLSAGTLILQAGCERLATPHSTFLYHYGQIDADNWQEVDFQKRLDQKWVELIAKRSGGKTSEHDIEIMHRGETYLTANDALLHGFIDKITTGRIL